MWKERLSALDKRRKRILQAGGQDRIEKQHKSGKLNARERIEMLLMILDWTRKECRVMAL